jgi:hypothetical protein
VAESTQPEESPSKPSVVDVVPVEAVEPLMIRSESELRRMRLELAEALREAEAAEQRLRVHPAASVYDDAFEARVLAHVEGSVSNVGGGTDPTSTSGLIGAMARDGEGAPEPPPDSADRSGFTRTEEGPQDPADPAASTRPRTVVVDRGRPRTVVVDRGAPVTPASSVPSPAAPPPRSAPPSAMPEPVFASSPGAERFITTQANVGPVIAEGQRGSNGSRRHTKSGRVARLPARLLIQAGVIVVIIALLLLKLG